MPTVVLFFDGVAKDKIIGFEGLADDLPEGKEDEWSTIQLQRLLASKDAVHAENIVDEDRIVADAQAAMQSMRSTIFSNLMAQDDYDLDNLSD